MMMNVKLNRNGCLSFVLVVLVIVFIVITIVVGKLLVLQGKPGSDQSWFAHFLRLKSVFRPRKKHSTKLRLFFFLLSGTSTITPSKPLLESDLDCHDKPSFGYCAPFFWGGGMSVRGLVKSCIFMWQTWPKGCEKRKRVGHLKIVNYARLTKNARIYMGVSKNKGTPKSLILIGFFPLFSPSILGVFPLLLETPI